MSCWVSCARSGARAGRGFAGRPPACAEAPSPAAQGAPVLAGDRAAARAVARALVLGRGDRDAATHVQGRRQEDAGRKPPQAAEGSPEQSSAAALTRKQPAGASVSRLLVSGP